MINHQSHSNIATSQNSTIRKKKFPMSAHIKPSHKNKPEKKNTQKGIKKKMMKMKKHIPCSLSVTRNRRQSSMTNPNYLMSSQRRLTSQTTTCHEKLTPNIYNKKHIHLRKKRRTERRAYEKVFTNPSRATRDVQTNPGKTKVKENS